MDPDMPAGPGIRQLLDLEQVGVLIDRFTAVTGYAIALRDNDGKILLHSPSNNVCDTFHRSCPASFELCERGKTQPCLDYPPESESYCIYTCPLGLNDAACPVIIEGTVYGVFFTGQTLFAPPDIDFFTRQAETYGFPSDEYIAAIKDVKISTEKEFRNFLDLFASMVQMISEQGMQRLKSISQARVLESLNKKLRRETEILNEVNKVADVGYLLFNRVEETGFFSPGSAFLTGTNPKNPYSIEGILNQIHPEDRESQKKNIEKLSQGEIPEEISFRIIDTEGDVRYITGSAKILSVLSGEILVTLCDVTNKVLNEEKLIRINKQFEEAQRIASIGSFEYWEDIDRMYLSREAYRISGFQEGMEISLSDCKAVVHPEDLDRYLDHLSSINRSKSPLQTEYRIIRIRDGRTVHIRMTTSSHVHDTGIPIHIGTIQDITAEYMVKKALEDQHALMKSLLDIMPAGIFWMDKNLVHQGCNRVFAYDADETVVENIIGKTDWYFRNTSQDAEKYDAQNREIIATGKPLLNSENRIVRSDGSISYSYTNKVPLFDANNQISGVLAVYSDITEMKQVYQKLEESLNQLRAVLDASSDPIFLLSLDLEIKLVSPSVEKMLGITPEQCLTMDVKDLLTDESYQIVQRHMPLLQELKSSNIPDPYAYNMLLELDMKNSNGSINNTEVHITPMTDGEGRTHTLLGIVRDVTRHREMEEHIRHASKMEAVGRLAGGIAHDFNNMLHVILGYGELLTDVISEEDELDMVQSIMEAGARAKKLVSQLLLFGRKSEAETSEIEVSRLLSSLLDILQPFYGEEVSCCFTGYPENTYIQGDLSQLEQAMLNIFLNAKESMPGWGEIILNAELFSSNMQDTRHFPGTSKGNYVMISITDSGTGIHQEDLPHIFEPFFSRKAADPSSGLGLAFVYAVVEQHNGYVQVISSRGYGTRVEVFLPVKTDGTDHSISGSLEYPSPKIFLDSLISLESDTGHGQCILVAEADDMVRYMAVKTLEQYGYQVTAAKDSKGLLEALQHSSPPAALIVLDMTMPRLDELKVFQSIDCLGSGIRVLCCGTHAAGADAGRLNHAASVHWLPKPYSMRSLVRQAAEILEDRS